MYNSNDIEKKWQNKWSKEKTFNVTENEKKKHYILVEFPYPSGDGLHIGHVRSYTALDAVARKKRRQGYNVLFPMGWDAFGLPAENYAIKHKIHPKEAVKENIATFKNQMQSLGISFDWSREINTTDEEYYKWTQWQFLKFFEKGMAYKDKKNINWCPRCKIGLSNEEATGGVCERCGHPTVQKEKEQWMLRMSDYSESLLQGLDDTEFQERIKLAQINWIGKSVGSEIIFKTNTKDELKVFTTRPDTIYGATFMVIAPEHPLIENNKEIITNYKELINYKEAANKKTEFERTEVNKEKTGIEIKGITAVNPVSGETIPIYISDYVMMNYGTGAIMAVPAHDERDFEFAIKFGINIKQVIMPETGEIRPNENSKNSIVAVVYNNKTDKYLTINWKNESGRLFIGGTRKESEDAIVCALREIEEETGYHDLTFIKKVNKIKHHYYAPNKNQAYNIISTGLYFELNSENKKETNLDETEINQFSVEWVSKDIIEKEIKDELHSLTFEFIKNHHSYSEDGIIINSEIINGLNKEEAINKMNEYIEDNNLGKKKINYKLQDWVFSRQRFWGEPIPMINCEDCGWIAVPEKDLPVVLPNVAAYEPTDNGESPLASIAEFVNTTCPNCNKPAKRETDTMPNWAGSSWYWLRYMDPFNKNEFASLDKMKYWGQVDWYNGGMEHATRHLLYARFWNQFLYNQDLVPYSEPFKVRVAHGMILGTDGEKMSKSIGNVISPTDIINEVGADTLRIYEMFIGDYEHDAAWNTDSLNGVRRFLDRIYRLKDKLVKKDSYTNEIIVHQTIKKVTDDIDHIKYNTAISALMIYLNSLEKQEEVTTKDYLILIELLNPFAPHITEELNKVLGLGEELYSKDWPTYVEELTIDNTYEMVIQINGRVREKEIVQHNISKEEMTATALANEKIIKRLEKHEVLKVIAVPNRLVNIVVK